MDNLKLGKSKLFPGKNHRDMLQDMCKEKVCNEKFDDCCWTVCGLMFLNVEENISIPWLEVCMIHLPNAMATPNKRSHDIAINVAYHLHNFYHRQKHPVDYLYSEFSNVRVWKK